MSKRFDLAIARGKPHEHFCEECKNIVYCRANPCLAPEWTECPDCTAGISLTADLTYVKKVPYRPGLNENDWN